MSVAHLRNHAVAGVKAALFGWFLMLIFQWFL